MQLGRRGSRDRGEHLDVAGSKRDRSDIRAGSLHEQLLDEAGDQLALRFLERLELREVDPRLTVPVDGPDDLLEEASRLHIQQATELTEANHGDRPLTSLVSRQGRRPESP